MSIRGLSNRRAGRSKHAYATFPGDVLVWRSHTKPVVTAAARKAARQAQRAARRIGR